MKTSLLLLLFFEVTLSQVTVKDDTFVGFFNQFNQKLKDKTGRLFDVPASPQKLEVLQNDVFYPNEMESCVEKRKNEMKSLDDTMKAFEEVAKKVGFHHVHRDSLVKRPHCQFDYVIPGIGNTTSRIRNELCVMEMLSGASAVGDYNNDGYVDVFFTVATGRSLLYKNNGDGTFTDVTASANVGPMRFGNGAGWADIDADGDLDLYVTTVGDSRYYLYINQGGYFTEEAFERGVSLQFDDERKLSGFTPSFGDFNNDGFLDMHVAEWFYHSTSGKVSACKLFMNRGHEKPGHFVDVTDSAGVNMDKFWLLFRNRHGSGTHTFGSTFTDFDNDGWSDLMINGDFGMSQLFWNNKDGTFTRCEKDCPAMGKDAMGLAIGDLNDDGLPDVFVTGVFWSEKSCRMYTCTQLGIGNGLYLNNGDRTFTDITDQAGVRDGHWSWGAAFLDFDNDGFLDLVSTNGFDSPSTMMDEEYGNDNMQLFHNRGEGQNNSMVDVAMAKGMEFTGLGRGLLVWDYDNDGDEDVLVAAHVGPPKLFQNNDGNKKNYLRVKVMNKCLMNEKKLCSSYGARVTIQLKSGRKKTAFIGSKTHFLSQSELTAHFGLGLSSDNVKVMVTWPRINKTMTLEDVPVNQIIQVTPPQGKLEETKTYSTIDTCPYLKITKILQQPAQGQIAINEDEKTLTFNPMGQSLFGMDIIHFKYRAESSVSVATTNNTRLDGTVTLDFRVNLDIYPTCNQDGRTIMGDMETMTSTDERRLDGFSNNKKELHWGSTVEDLIRLAPHAYADNISEPAGACSGHQVVNKKCPYPEELSGIGSNRPSARLISNTLMTQTQNHFSRRNMSDFTMHFGQFLAHDTDHSSPLPRFEFQYHTNHVWMPITIPKGDIHFDPYRTGKETMPFIRSSFNRCTGHYPGGKPRNQFNQLSAYLDANNVYGQTLERCGHLREYKNGRLRMSENLLLPKNDAFLANENPLGRPAEVLYLAGDTRANVQPGLTSIHVLFVREHNRLALQYQFKNPSSNDEEIFQKARRLLISEVQSITYNEYLPAILGGSQHIPVYTGYKTNIKPDISNEFATAAFRFGHSQVNSHLFRLKEDYTPIDEGHAILRDVYFKPNRLENEGGIDPILRGAIYFPAQEIDLMMVDEMRNTLFPTSAAAPGKQTGFDLASLNIQRGRDHGLADFNTVRKSLGLKPYTSFDSITSNKDIANKLKMLYTDLDNIDLWVGGLAEDHVHNSELGETFHAIMVEQFVRLRDADRFWYQNNLTREEIEMVESITMGEIIRLNTGFDNCPKHVFFSLQNCNLTKDHQCIPRHLSDEAYAQLWSAKVKLEDDANEKDEKILMLIIIACVLGALAFVVILVATKLLISSRSDMEKTPVHKTHSSMPQYKKESTTALELGYTNDVTDVTA